MTGKNIIPEGTVFGSIEPKLFLQHSGLELLEMMAAGKIPGPPIAKLLNFILSEVDLGRAVFRGIPTLDHYNPAGTVHGGWPATLLDSALGCAVQTKLPRGMMFTTIEFKINLVRPLFENSGEVVCEGKVVHFGRTIATSEATLKRADGKLVAHGTSTCAIFKAPS
ncbi:MAG: PaaI family thioesterase [Rhizobiaceae bacterium]|nr:PaaI family thioesterase [Rhizobiaceae bacterium]